jgi:predicted NUDIX family phosphoesterase
MADKSSERVLGLPTARFHRAGLFQGFRPFHPDLFAFLLAPVHLEYRPRSQAESDPTFKQLIPYLVLRCGGNLFHYTRGQSGTETRLRALRSVGVGGHISADEDSAAANPYRAGMLRELAEEVEILSRYEERPFGLINDDATLVGSVHLGVVHLLELAEPRVTPREDGIALAGFAPIAELRSREFEFETWSQFVLDALV